MVRWVGEHPLRGRGRWGGDRGFLNDRPGKGKHLKVNKENIQSKKKSWFYSIVVFTLLLYYYHA